MKKIVEKKEFNYELKLTEEYNKIISYQEDFPLCEADFLRLKSGQSKYSKLSSGLFLLTAGYLIALLAKYTARLFDHNIDIRTWEWIAPLVSAFIGIVIYICGIFISNDYKQIIKEITEHFKKAPRRRIAGRSTN